LDRFQMEKELACLRIGGRNREEYKTTVWRAHIGREVGGDDSGGDNTRQRGR